MSDDELTDADLRLVARHGSGNFVRAIAVVKLAKRQGQMDEIREKVEDGGGAPTG